MRYVVDIYVVFLICLRVGFCFGYEKFYLNVEIKRFGYLFNNRLNYGLKRGVFGVDGGCLMIEGGMLGGYILGLVWKWYLYKLIFYGYFYY